MSLVKEILRTTAKYYPLGYSQLYESLYKETIYGRKLNKNSLSATLSRMKKDGLLETRNKKFLLTKEGLDRLDKDGAKIKTFFNQKNIADNREKLKNLVLIFDIPEKQKLYREWLRSELVGLGFTMIQKSVWLGPALPKEFVEYLNELGLFKHIRFFKTTEKDLI
ncbi:MAG: hypothetical protein A3C70_00330 [Candidatus Zambryskibacteria bacterium RIFCSPHIGHO2_02_FULL_43_14]|uniref:Transcriptional repressor PaaX-like central Cas2-like domain-containing protein n=1 Tax=Candidatus Zambryskibacteria bacterium RIFCSPHIGHO2_02_FULL_43_14 TaxID=1802748 RepID=A0A1G2THL0_9BACT|nr:MAG: hypothetical protein A2829_01910 [Candidatus Zambryskibacteria bacterium RIFCSPHIGHO2_01_FULL_43_60]OHA96790.1 MAG: hypothetical protein A3C70_00330 [Candidatus Zambryskibacteria bacterium RIFCSPHIGHO2_02_FULL_43_14]OHB04045.1 MAG: hypothetical protein A3B03_01155 [Candidatus Zambryskibacteria bacterium RIFCSPLOWO2_01_FULL_42_41]